jgi:hypothetical protein
MAAEMQRMRQQLEVMQAELICARGGGPSTTDVQVLTYLQLPQIVATKMSYAVHVRGRATIFPCTSEFLPYLGNLIANFLDLLRCNSC